ncbi:transcriptional regulator [Corynebacterium suranareeae]|uniref:Transcriptional regulator n=1 Tax=Corynebacterium suranareeae TaxID=2506452 RepID=A0A160PM02_9CORY|nr:LysR family transcriptional regulator [Corynebacterium suranareeae]BAU94276.1 transcriptional regulator [Corynebacterium suranareeae]
MDYRWPNLQTLALLVAIVEEGSLGAGARKVGMAQPNASRAIAELEVEMKTELLVRHPRGSHPTTAGLALVEHSRELLQSAQDFTAWVTESRTEQPLKLHIGASMTIAETLLPSWIATMRMRFPDSRVDVSVMNSSQVVEAVQQGQLQLGFIETPHVPVRLNARVVQEDKLIVVISPNHKWASRTGKISLQELSETPLIVREPGSGTREALQELLGDYDSVEPIQVLNSNAAVRVVVEAGAGPAVLGELALRDHLALGRLLSVPFEGSGVTRPLTAVWSGPRRLPVLAAELVAIASSHI